MTLTPKGVATRSRIVEVAAALIYERGVHGTNNELLRRTAGVSGSQLNHYFPDKVSLLRAVIRWRADETIARHEQHELDSVAGLRRWAGSYVDWDLAREGGCGFGSLAAEVLRTGIDVRGELRDGFDRWADVFRRGLRRMRDRGDLVPQANVDHLANAVLAGFQGGMLLAQAAHDVGPLRDALHGVIAYVATFAREDL
jgi:AcrR family transcriptional regulator